MVSVRSISALMLAARTWAGDADVVSRDTLDTSFAGDATLHLVIGPLPPTGDPRGTHHLEHAVLHSRARAEAAAWGATVAAYTGPDSLHLVWTGPPASLDAGRERMTAWLAAPPSTDDWSRAQREIAEEAAVTAERARPPASALGAPDRLLWPTGGATLTSPNDAWSELSDAPWTWMVAPEGRGADLLAMAAESAQQANVRTLRARTGWQVTGPLDCRRRRALRAAAMGWAEAAELTAHEVWSPSRSLVWLDGSLDGRPGPAAYRAARQFDVRSVTGTQRRWAHSVDQAWFQVGEAGFGVCPAPTPLSRAEVRTAFRALRATESVISGSRRVDVAPVEREARAAVFVPGDAAFEANQDREPSLFWTQWGDGWTVDGPADAVARVPVVASDARWTEEDAVVALVAGGQTPSMGCRAMGVTAPDCGVARARPRPTETAAAGVIDDVSRVHLILGGDISAAVAQAVFGPGGPVQAALANGPAPHRVQVTLSPHRVDVRVACSLAQRASVIAAMREGLDAAMGDGPLSRTEARAEVGRWWQQLRARPWEAVAAGIDLAGALDASAETADFADLATWHTVWIVGGPEDGMQAALAPVSPRPARILSASMWRAQGAAAGGQ